MGIRIHEHTLCPKALLPVAEFPLSLRDWCGRLDDLEEKHLVPNQFDAQFHGWRKSSWYLTGKNIFEVL